MVSTEGAASVRSLLCYMIWDGDDGDCDGDDDAYDNNDSMNDTDTDIDYKIVILVMTVMKVFIKPVKVRVYVSPSYTTCVFSFF